MQPLSIGIVGTGPAALMAGTELTVHGHRVQFFDRQKAPGRKFLVAGHGGFNLTHSEDIENFIERYDREIIKSCVREYTNGDFTEFLKKIGIDTFVGSSGKVFPVKGIKPIEVLNAWLEYLKRYGAAFYMEHQLIDFKGTDLTFNNKGGNKRFKYDRVILALGGGSWSSTGSDGKWVDLFREKGIQCADLMSSNSGFELDQLGELGSLQGSALKNCRVFSDTLEKHGDAVLTSYGIEGAPVYALNGEYRKGKKIFIDLKPDLSEPEIKDRLSKGVTVTESLKALKLSKGAIALLKNYLSKEEFTNPSILAARIKKLELKIAGVRPLEEVISSVGGIVHSEVTADFELVRFPGIYCVGEMIDWDAPTGGYLIQGCVSSGMKAARSILIGQS